MCAHIKKHKTVTLFRKKGGSHNCEMLFATSDAICFCRIDAEVPARSEQ